MTIDAATVYARLSSQHNYNPEKQAYKATLGAEKCVVYRPDGKPEEVYARDVEHFVAKGFALTGPQAPEPEAEAPAPEPVIGAAE